MALIVKKTAILILIFNFYFSAAQTQKQMLSGNWLFDYETSVSHMEESAKKMLIKNPSLQEKLENSYKYRQITFGSQGDYLLHLAGGKQTTGSWGFNAANGNNIIINIQNQIENLSIVMLSASCLVLKLENAGKAKPMFSTWYLKKI